MSLFQTRYRVLKGMFLVVVLGGSGYLIAQGAWLGSLLLLWGLWRMREWNRRVAPLALEPLPATSTLNGVCVAHPVGWELQVAATGGVLLHNALAKRGSEVEIRIERSSMDPAARAAELLDELRAACSLSGELPTVRRVAGVELSGVRALASPWPASSPVVLALAGRLPDGGTLAVRSYKADGAFSDATVDQILRSVSLDDAVESA